MSEWIKGNGSQINQLKSWLSDARRVNVAREIERIENINPSEAVAMYRAWEGRILSMMQQGLVSAAQEIWISYSDRDLAHEILRKQWSDQFRQRVAKSDSELRDAALRKRARKNQKTKTSGGRDVIRDQATTTKPREEPYQVKSTGATLGDLGKLQSFYPQRAEELRSHARSGGKLSGPIEAVASSVWYLSQLWLVFLDGNDFGLTRDRSIYDQITSLANSHPRCSIEHEAEAWMHAVAATLSNFEVSIALKCSVDTVGSILLLNGNFDDTYRMLVRSRVDPASR